MAEHPTAWKLAIEAYVMPKKSEGTNEPDDLTLPSANSLNGATGTYRAITCTRKSNYLQTRSCLAALAAPRAPAAGALQPSTRTWPGRGAPSSQPGFQVQAGFQVRGGCWNTVQYT